MQENLNNNPICLQDDSQKITEFGYDFTKYTNIDDFRLDEELISKFCPIAKKLNLNQEDIELLMEIALEMSKKQKSIYEKSDEDKLKEKIEEFSNLFKQDDEIPSHNYQKTNEYMKVANEAYRKMCSCNLKAIFKSTGLVCHPELIKLFHKIGELIQEDTLTILNAPAEKELTPAQILYGTTKKQQ